MKLEIEMLSENEDGSANVQVDMDEEAKVYLLQMGMIALIKEGIEKYPLPEQTNE